MIKAKQISQNWQEIGVYFPLVAMLVFCFWYSSNAPIGDFGNYYFVSLLWVKKQLTAEVYLPHFFNTTIECLTGKPSFLSFAPNTPFIAIIFAPFTLLEPAQAKLLFNIISASLFLISIRQLQRIYSASMGILFLLPVIFFIPIKNQILFGQVYFLLLFLLVQWLLALKNQNYWLASAWLAIALAIKLFPALMVLPVLFQRQFKIILPLLVSSAVLVGVTLLFIPFSVIDYYLYEVLPRALNVEIAGLYVDNYQSAYMLLKRLLVYHEVENQMGLLQYPNLFHGLILAYKGLILALLWSVSKKKSSFESTFALWLLGTVLLLDYGSTYALLILIPAYFYSSRIKSIKYRLTFGLLLLLSINLPFKFLVFPLNYLRLLLLVMISFLLIYDVISIQKQKAVILTILGFFIGYFKPTSTENDTYATSYSMPILSYDYRVSDNQIFYYFHSAQGRKESVFNWPVPILTLKPLQILDNQVYFNNQPVTRSGGLKKKAFLLNDNQIIYLSDQGRGIGFYQLRKLDVAP